MSKYISNGGIYTQRYFSLPELSSHEDLAKDLKLSIDIISKYFNNNKRYYNQYEVAKKNGKKRTISSPHLELKGIQRWILRNIFDKLSPSPYAKGFVKGISLLKNAEPHKGKQYILNIDLKDFFDNIPANFVYSVFNSLGYSPKLSFQLTKICTINSVLPQGAPTSPALSNFVCNRLDYRLGNYCKKNALVYTRYADDLTISGNRLLSMKEAKKMAIKIIENEKFIINRSKMKLVGPSLKREVTGLVINSEIGIGRKKLNYYRMKIYNLYKANDPAAKSIIDGVIAFVSSVDKNRAETLKKYAHKLFPTKYAI
jgi:RNA-directed DNA polymerase